tara:strand:- start:21 stop:323 length:303 start_codon:yes stop_codon:yes gene_type:complete
MKDMLGRTIGPGDFFLIPGGNVRYGGLVLEIGIVLSMTEKRIKTLITRFDKIKLKPTTKTPTKVFKISSADIDNVLVPAMIELQAQFKLHEEYKNPEKEQ